MSVLFPSVPNIAGVPPLLKTAGSIETTISQVTTLLKSLFGSTPVWDVLDEDGASIGEFDTIVAVEPRKEYRVGSYPVEDGAFQSYSRVEMPFDVRVVFAVGGATGDQSDFVDAINLAIASTTLYTLVTPQQTIDNLNAVRWDYAQSGQSGAGMILIAVSFQEIRDYVETSYSNDTQSPDGADNYDGGTVQTDDAGNVQTGTAVVGDDGLEGDVPIGLDARERSPAAEALDVGEPYVADKAVQSESLPALH